MKLNVEDALLWFDREGITFFCVWRRELVCAETEALCVGEVSDSERCPQECGAEF